MTIDTKDGVQFDPGFIQHMSAFEPNIEYVYNNLNSFKNFNQKKLQFKNVLSQNPIFVEKLYRILFGLHTLGDIYKEFR